MMDTIRAKRDEIHAIAKRHKAEKLWVFGSCARGEETPESDVDFLVEFGNGSSLLSHVHLMNVLRDCFGKKVDVVSTQGGIVMKKTIAMLCTALFAALGALAATWTDPEIGITWMYTVSDSKASVGGVCLQNCPFL